MKSWVYVGCSVALILAMASNASGVTGPVGAAARCQVVNGAKLPAASGGAAALCAALERAVAANAVKVRFTVQVSVGSRSMLSAVVTLSDGRKLPALRMANMDRPIGKGTLERFGAAIADHVSGALR